MPANAVFLNVDADRVDESLREALQKLDSAGDGLVLDFSAVRRMDSKGLRALEELARAAGARNVRIALRGVGVDVYRVFKLLKLEPQLSFPA